MWRPVSPCSEGLSWSTCGHPIPPAPQVPTWLPMGPEQGLGEAVGEAGVEAGRRE